MPSDLTERESATAASLCEVLTLGTETGLDDSVEASSFELFREWIHSRWYPKRARFSFLQGNLEAEMGPESLFDHNLVKGAIGSVLGTIAEQDQLGRLYVDRSLFVREDLQLATEPDLMFCLWQTLREKRVENLAYKKARKGKVEVHGCPDLIVEIVSNSSVRKDKVLLKQLYFAAGFPEYWLIDARRGRLAFIIFNRGESEYVAAAMDQEDFRPSIIFNRSLRLERYVDPIGEDAFRLVTRNI